MKIEKITVPAQPGLDPIHIYFEDIEPGKGRIIIICYDMAWTGYWQAIGKETSIKDFFAECDDDYLASNISAGRQYKGDIVSRNYIKRIVKAAHDFILEAKQ